MKHLLKTLARGTLLLGTSAANAAQTDITVTADIDPTVALTQADGTSLPDSVKMHIPPPRA